jgi:APA family basic amino acid/polyamine antiporter
MTTTKKYSLSVAIALVIANMIGTGVFTSLGYQVGPLPSGFVILILWLVGGVVALSGAFTYAEIATTLKKSGGEYYFLGKIFHPAVGFAAGWMSLLVGFAGAISAVAIAIGEYSKVLTGLPVKVIAVLSILAVSAIHWFGVKTGGQTQKVLTSIKLLLIVFFCIAPFFISPDLVSHISYLPHEEDWSMIMSPGFAVSLVYVVYAYTGWNAAAYIVGNLENPSKTLPRALIIGTLTVVLVYLALNAMFLYSATFAELNGQNDIGNVVAIKLFGQQTGTFFSGIFSIALLSTLSAMTIAGPRVTEAMGMDYPIFNAFTRKNKYEMPYIAILVQAAWAIFLVLVSSFKEIIQYISISLSIFSLLTVIGIFVLRKRTPPSERTFSVPLYPLPPIVFIVCTCWMIYYVTNADPKIILYSVATALPGFILYFTASKTNYREH